MSSLSLDVTVHKVAIKLDVTHVKQVLRRIRLEIEEELKLKSSSKRALYKKKYSYWIAIIMPMKKKRSNSYLYRLSRPQQSLPKK